MTRDQICDTLDTIEATDKGHVHAARRGIVAAVPGRGEPTIAIRNVNGVCQAEQWPDRSTTGSVVVWSVPASLQERALAVLEGL